MSDFTFGNVTFFVIGLIVSGVGVYLTMKYRPRGRLDFVIGRYLSLIDEITENFPELALTYEGCPVTRQLILVEGFLLNSGYLDVAQEDIKQPISLIVPEGFAIRQSMRSGECENLKFTDKSITIDIELLKADEAVPFKFLLEGGRQDNAGSQKAGIDEESDAAKHFIFLSKVAGSVKNSKIRVQTLIGASKGDLSRPWVYSALLIALLVSIGLFALSIAVSQRANFANLLVEYRGDTMLARITPNTAGDEIVLRVEERSFLDTDWLWWSTKPDESGKVLWAFPVEAASKLTEKDTGLKIVKFVADDQAWILVRALIWTSISAVVFFYWIFVGKFRAWKYFSDRTRKWRMLRRVRRRAA
jgi:hypothetical protein